MRPLIVDEMEYILLRYLIILWHRVIFCSFAIPFNGVQSQSRQIENKRGCSWSQFTVMAPQRMRLRFLQSVRCHPDGQKIALSHRFSQSLQWKLSHCIHHSGPHRMRLTILVDMVFFPKFAHLLQSFITYLTHTDYGVCQMANTHHAQNRLPSRKVVFV